MNKRSGSIQDYEVGQLLGRGASASVYKAVHKNTGDEVAIKMIEKNMIISRNLRDRVYEEVKNHIQLEHSSILKLYDVFDDPQYVYLVLELCHNGQMQRYLGSRSRRLTEDETRVIMRQIVDGIEYLHRNQMVHRDLSLANLLLTKDMHVKIADFGLSATLKDSDQQHQTLCGTPNYMSPEAASGSAYSLETDLWSLGVILYTCLVGKTPFEASGVQATLKRVRQIEYELPNFLSPEARDLITQIFRVAGDRISLQGIKAHPFMKADSTAAMMTKKVAEMSMDSGCGTISSTHHSGSSSCSNMYAPSRRTRPIPAFPLQQETHREEDRSHLSIDSGNGSTRTYFSHSSSANVHSHSSSANVCSHSSSASDRHPPSPPVRERDSQSEEELRRTRNAMRSIKLLSKQQNIHLATCREAEARPGIHGCQSRNEQFTAAKSGAIGAAEAATDQMHFHSLPPSDHQKVERQHQAFDPCRYKKPDCCSSCTNAALRPVQHNDRTDKYGRSLCEAQQPQHASQIPSVYLENMQTQDLASKAYNFLARDEIQQHLRSSQPVEFVYNEVPIQFSSPEPASRNVKLTKQEIQHCLLESNKSDNKRDSKEVYSLPPPVITEGITPLRDKTKNSVLHITENGSVVVEFVKKGTVETIMDVITISCDGMRMMVYKPPAPVPVRDQPLLPPSPEECKTFVYPNIPEKYLKKYLYAAKMVKCLRDKMPKVTAYDSKAKCLLLENGAFRLEFYDGRLAKSDGKSVIITEADGTSLTVSAELDSRLSSETKEMLTYIQECRQIYLMLEATISSLQERIPVAKHLFPIMVGRRPRGITLAHKNVQALGIDKKKLEKKAVSETTGLKSTLSKTPKTTASTDSSSITSLGSDSTSAHMCLKTNQGSASDSNCHQRKVGDSVSLKGSHLSTTASQSLNTTAMTTMSRENYSSSSDNSLGRVELPGADPKSQTFVPGVGWASMVNGGININFHDGTRLDANADKFTYWTSDSCCCEYTYSSDPPDTVKEKLRQALEVYRILQAKPRAKSTSVLSSASASR